MIAPTRRMRGMWAALVAPSLAACAAPGGTWSCPPGWASLVAGGCAPTVLVCTTADTRDQSACSDSRVAFTRASEGTIQGGWIGDGSTDAPPARDAPLGSASSSCPMAWTRTADGLCEPSLRTDCGTDSEPLPDGTCTATGTSTCPASRFADIDAVRGTDPVYYVDASADPSLADGTPTHPYATLAPALARTGRAGDTWIVLAAGDYLAPPAITTRVNLVGVCASRVHVAANGGSPSIDVSGATARTLLRGLRLAGGSDSLTVRDGAHARIEDSIVAGAAGRALRAVGAGTVVETAGVWIDGTQPTASGTLGVGLSIEQGAVLTARRTVVSNSPLAGVFTTGADSQATLSDSVVRDTIGRMGAGGNALYAGRSTVVTAERTLLVRAMGASAIAPGSGAQIRLIDTVIAGGLDRGLAADGGGSIDATRTLVRNARGVGIYAGAAATRVTLTDVAVIDTVAAADLRRGGGVGVGVDTGAHLDATGLRVRRATGIGVLGTDSATLVISDAVVDATRAIDDSNGGRGASVEIGASLQATRVRVVDNTEIGVSAIAGALLELHASVVEGTHARADGQGGRGLAIESGGVLTMDRSHVRNNVEAGLVMVGAATRATLSDSAITDSQPRANGTFGRGIEVDGGRLEATRVLIARHREIGVSIVREGSSARLEDTIITDVTPGARGFGLGLGVFGHADVEIARVAIEHVAGAGVAAVPFTPRVDHPEDGAMERDASVHGADLFVRSVASSTIRFDANGGMVMPVGRAVAYALHAGNGCSLTIDDGTIIDGGFGVAITQGSLTLRDAVIQRQREAAGVANGVAASQPGLMRVAYAGNANDSVLRDLEIPEATTLAPPDAVCGIAGCM